ncbi:uncharacterized protein EKO05_0009499 [Ascochyta rabiei]|uniref:uncharacterized protein n=1 Tax=Didymella rabiei TaxID=5454 RepID=UPI00220ED15A|nr:uncharacterized protein EKO05_0009499 [Ascochyta rabiei]UPX19230.1 hypothetical protein EKO05_0009499 [Ascochyta rabiei]
MRPRIFAPTYSSHLQAPANTPAEWQHDSYSDGDDGWSADDEYEDYENSDYWPGAYYE